MGSEQNIEWVKRHFANEVAGNSPAVLAQMPDDCHHYMRPIFDERIDDKSQITAIHHGQSAAFEDGYIEIEQISANDDMCATVAILGGKHVGECTPVFSCAFATARLSASRSTLIAARRCGNWASGSLSTFDDHGSLGATGAHG